MKLRVSLLHYPVLTLGPFDRVVLWTQGCSIRCAGCMSKHTWDSLGGYELLVEELSEKILSYGCSRLTISGGEPLDQYEALLRLLESVRHSVDDILLYTGYTLSVVKKRFDRVLELVDVLVAGPFVAEKPSKSRLKGSENQKVIFIKKELELSYRAFENSAMSVQSFVSEGKACLVGVPERWPA